MSQSVAIMSMLSRVQLCNPMDCSPPCSFVHEIFQEKNCSGLPFPLPGDLSDLGIEPTSSAWQVYPLPLSHLGSRILISQYTEAQSCTVFLETI